MASVALELVVGEAIALTATETVAETAFGATVTEVATTAAAELTVEEVAANVSADVAVSAASDSAIGMSGTMAPEISGGEIAMENLMAEAGAETGSTYVSNLEVTLGEGETSFFTNAPTPMFTSTPAPVLNISENVASGTLGGSFLDGEVETSFIEEIDETVELLNDGISNYDLADVSFEELSSQTNIVFGYGFSLFELETPTATSLAATERGIAATMGTFMASVSGGGVGGAGAAAGTTAGTTVTMSMVSHYAERFLRLMNYIHSNLGNYRSLITRLWAQVTLLRKAKNALSAVGTAVTIITVLGEVYREIKKAKEVGMGATVTKKGDVVITGSKSNYKSKGGSKRVNVAPITKKNYSQTGGNLLKKRQRAEVPYKKKVERVLRSRVKKSKSKK